MATTEVLQDSESGALLRRYADGTLDWSSLRRSGIDNYADVLAGLGALGLRPPLADMIGPNVASREKGRAILRTLLAVTSA